MKILLIEPYLTDSHRQWVDGISKGQRWESRVLSLQPRHWKWRMHAAAISLAEQVTSLAFCPDLILASEMMDLALLKALLGTHAPPMIPIVLYLHENQLTYPVSSHDQDQQKHIDQHYAFVNYSSALVADSLIFNSRYHHDTFLKSIPNFLKKYPKPNTVSQALTLKAKSHVIYPGLDTNVLDQCKTAKTVRTPILLWNHRWEYDKNPDLFFQTLYDLSETGIDFMLVVLGRSFSQTPTIFKEARQKLARHILQWGFVDSKDAYYRWLWQADVVVSTSHQDFFGISIVEAIYCGCWPILPDRLAFPEHIPEAHHPACIYRRDAQLLPLLRQTMADLPISQERIDEMSEKVRSYSLSATNAQYLEIFEQLLGKSSA